MKFTKKELKALDRLYKAEKDQAKTFDNAEDAIAYIHKLCEPVGPNPVKVLQCIETLTLLFKDGPITLPNAEKILDEIYKYSHLFSGCTNPHEDWVKEYFKNEKNLLKY